MQLPVANLRAQTYDGAANMAGAYNHDIIINLFANHQSQLNAVAICNIYRYLVDNICVDKLAKSFSGRSDVFGRWQ